MKRANAMGLLLLTASLTLLFLRGPGQAGDNQETIWKKFLPGDVYQELVLRELKTVQESIGKTKIEDIQKGRVAALMIVGCTLSVKEGNKDDLEGVRAAALRLAELVGEQGKESEAKKLIEAISSFKGAKVENAGMNFRKYVPSDYDIMVKYMAKAKEGDGLHPDLQFSSRLQGGEEYIENLFSYLNKKPLPDKHMDKGKAELVLTGYRTAVSAGVIHSYVPKQKTKKRDPELWVKTSIAMRESALDLMEAAGKEDGVALQKAAGAVLDSCVKCHKMFQ